MSELYKKFRPVELETVVGQDGPVASIRKYIDKGNLPHSILLTGPSGCGKTTIARILGTHLKCGERDFIEINAADTRGIELIRDIRTVMNMAPLFGSSRIWLIDEAHKLSSEAQAAFLKILEDTPKHVYFILATTDPKKLVKTIHTRCAEFKLNSISDTDMGKVIRRVVVHEEKNVSDVVIREIVEVSEGSARKALVVLDQIIDLDSEEAQIEALKMTSASKDVAIELARALINPRASWGDVAGILKELKDDPEGIRYMILGYCRSVLLGGGKLAPRAYMVIDIFSKNFYDSKQAGLAAACWEVIHPL